MQQIGTILIPYRMLMLLGIAISIFGCLAIVFVASMKRIIGGMQERKTLSRCDDDITVSRLKLAGKNLKECRFAGTVCSDQTVAVTLGKFDVDIFEKCFLANTQCNIIC